MGKFDVLRKLSVRFLFGILISLLLFCACQKERGEEARDPLDESYQLIDRGDYAQAIQKLNNLSAKDSRPVVKVALASAYAARGGIRVEDYWGFVIGFNPHLVSPGSISVNDSESLVKALAVWDFYKDRVKAIPTVGGQALLDLRAATDILSNVYTPGGRLYRGILNLILFKSYIFASSNFWLDFNKAIEKLGDGEARLLCRFNFEEVMQWLNPVSYHLLETLNDFILAFPADRTNLEPSRDRIQTVYETIIKAMQGFDENGTCQ